MRIYIHANTDTRPVIYFLLTSTYHDVENELKRPAFSPYAVATSPHIIDDFLFALPEIQAKGG